MYEKHIETLQRLKNSLGAPESDTTVNAAIELMRAAEPKDPAAER